MLVSREFSVAVPAEATRRELYKMPCWENLRLIGLDWRSWNSVMGWDNIDLFFLESTIFKERLCTSVERIHGSALGQLNSVYADVSKDLHRKATCEGWSDEGIAQYDDYLEYEKLEQVRAIATMALAMIGALIEALLKHARTHLDKSHPRTKGHYGKTRDSYLIQLVEEYRERFGINLCEIKGFKTAQQIVLARNSCLHNDCVPTRDYLTQTDTRLLDAECKIDLKPAQLRQFIEEISEFADSLYKKLDQVAKGNPA